MLTLTKRGGLVLSNQSKIAVVTGGSRGIGKAIVKRLLESDVTVVFGSRSVDEIKKTEQELSEFGSVHGYQLDVAERENVNSFVEKAIGQFGKIDILVNCAGVNVRLPAEEFPEDSWEQIININLTGAYRMCQEVGRHMIANKYGKIINITSVQSHSVTPYQSAYASAKAGLLQYTKLLAAEWGQHNIHVNAVSPGYIETALTEKALSEPIYRDSLLSQTPQKRFGKPEEIAEAVEFLSSDRASFVNGHALIVDGGFLAGFPSIEPPKS